MSTKEVQHYTRDDINAAWNALSKEGKIEVLFEALDYMQQYNGRSKLDCVTLAMGYVIDYNDEGLKIFKKKS